MHALIQRTLSPELGPPSTAAGAKASPSARLPGSVVVAKMRLSSGEESLIDEVIGGKQPARASAEVSQPAASSTAAVQTPPDKKAAFKAAMSGAEKPLEAPPSRAESRAAARPSDFGSIVESARRKLEEVEAPLSPPSSSAIAGRRLELEELDAAAKTLQLLVRHRCWTVLYKPCFLCVRLTRYCGRGGGPFGAGRLGGVEAAELAAELRGLTRVLAEDRRRLGDTPPVEPHPPAAPSAREPKAAPLSSPPREQPPRPRSPEPEPVIATTKVAAQPDPVRSIPAPAPPAPSVPAPAASEPVVMTIAQGLDAFLQRGDAMGTEDLQGLRDALIDCLGLIQAEIKSRPLSPRASEQPRSPAPKPPPAPSAGRLHSRLPYCSAVIIMLAGLTAEETLDQQLRLAMGLLLKHRGGPSFGHGRLQGQELSVMETRLQSLAAALADEAGAEGRSLLRLPKD